MGILVESSDAPWAVCMHKLTAARLRIVLSCMLSDSCLVSGRCDKSVV